MKHRILIMIILMSVVLIALSLLGGPAVSTFVTSVTMICALVTALKRPCHCPPPNGSNESKGPGGGTPRS
jgi:hypothetical protein